MRGGVALWRWLPALLLAAALAGCGGGIPTAAPQVSLADIGIEEIALFEQKLRVVLRVQNPNDIAIEVEGLTLTIEVNDRPFARGVSSRQVRVPRFGDATLDVTTISFLGNVLLQLRDLNAGRHETLDYRLRGTMTLNHGSTVPFEQRGQIPLQVLFGDKNTDRR